MEKNAGRRGYCTLILGDLSGRAISRKVLARFFRAPREE